MGCWLYALLALVLLGESSNCSVSLYDIEGLLISAPMAASMFDPVAVAERTQVPSLVAGLASLYEMLRVAGFRLKLKQLSSWLVMCRQFLLHEPLAIAQDGNDPHLRNLDVEAGDAASLIE